MVNSVLKLVVSGTVGGRIYFYTVCHMHLGWFPPAHLMHAHEQIHELAKL